MGNSTQSQRPPCATWPQAMLIAHLFALDPHGLGGVVIKGRGSPFVDAWLELVAELLPDAAPMRRCPVQTGDDRLLGGLDLATSLALGRPVVQRGLLSEVDGGVLVLPMAERLTTSTAARIAAALDQGAFQLERDGLTSRLPASFGIVLIDESHSPEETPPAALLERCSFRLDGNGLGLADLTGDGLSAHELARARADLPNIGHESEELLDAICEAAQAFGLHSARPALMCLRVAKLAACLDGRSAVGLGDVTLAAQLVLAPQALQLPPPPEQDETQDREPDPPDTNAEEPPEPPPPEPHNSSADADAQSQEPEPPHPPTINPADVLVDAVKSALPAELIAALSSGAKSSRASRGAGGGGGTMEKSVLRGRPIRSRTGSLKPGERLNIIETLRAAAPWQKIRRRGEGAIGARSRIEVRKSDFRIRCFAQPKEATTILVVDASGSSAFQRLAEAKGAVEILLAQAYVDRSRVALVAFRHQSADVLLPPTRSLARARRQLADLAGGGGTPLAAGLEVALTLALAEKAKCRTPRLLVLTDGRANVTRDGQSGRSLAMAEALQTARMIGLSGIAAVHIDTSPFPRPEAHELALAMGGTYAPLPYLNAQAITAV